MNFKSFRTQIILMALIVIFGLTSAITFAGTDSNSECKTGCGKCGASDQKPTMHKHGEEAPKTDIEAEVPTCHTHDASCDNGCAHIHSADCVAFYQDMLYGELDRVCTHEHSADCEGESGCTHEHDLDCMITLAADYGHVCTDECRDICHSLMNAAIGPCTDCGPACTQKGCDHTCSQTCIDGYVGIFEAMHAVGEEQAATM